MAKQVGTVKNFNSKRGFGFITPNNGGDDVFCHWQDIQTDDRWPKMEKDQKVQFTTETDENGKVRATNVTKPGGSKLSVTADDKEYGDFRYPGTVKWFRGWTGAEGGYGFITLGMDATVGDHTIAEGEDVYVSREELFAENPVNPKVCSGMEVEFLIAKTTYDKYCACEVTLPGGTPIGDLPERPERPAKGAKGSKGSKGKGKGKSGKGAPTAQKSIVKPPPAPAKGKGKGKGKSKGKSKW